jgi:putative phosphoribosyl transferase
LLIVGADDPATLKLNKSAQKRILAECELKTVKNKTGQGETHPFSEPGKLEEVSRLSSEWFGNKLASIA